MRRGESGKAFVDQMASLPLRDSHPGTKLPKKSQQNIFNCSKAQYKGEEGSGGIKSRAKKEIPYKKSR